MKKLTPILNILLLALIILFYNSCKDKDCHKDGTCPPEYYRIRIGEEVKSYLWSLPGSYWIYKNTKTGQVDTQTCSSFSLDSVKVTGDRNDTKHITIEYDVYRRLIFSTFNQWLYFDQTLGNNPNSSYFNNGATTLKRSANGPGNIVPFLYPFSNGAASGNGSSLTTFIGTDSSLTIQGKTYTNVAKFDIDKDDIWEEKLNCIRAHTIYYWAKDVGLIKKEMISCNYSWEIIEYKIIK